MLEVLMANVDITSQQYQASSIAGEFNTPIFVLILPLC
jgi:hypothetical protein